MSVWAKMAIAKPEGVEVTMQLTMTVAEWRIVLDALQDDRRYEVSRVKSLIVSVIDKAIKTTAESIEDAKDTR